ncbi:hypothetical protein F2P81_007573 [Scophthalmus maximus]|uniref:Uncharacterized protein n=1 Tax=Scophthalmus maximus TaxID=52904 RepID=A0A6A4T4T1_SCOMX|nr:hypothetical protein F2P81_007573 [Scophthalmus maximus]
MIRVSVYFILTVKVCFIFVSVLNFLSRTTCFVLNCNVCAPASGKNRNPAYLLRRAAERRSCDGAVRSQWKYTH